MAVNATAKSRIFQFWRVLFISVYKMVLLIPDVLGLSFVFI